LCSLCCLLCALCSFPQFILGFYLLVDSSQMVVWVTPSFPGRLCSTVFS
jgi:hypothetical protein